MRATSDTPSTLEQPLSPPEASVRSIPRPVATSLRRDAGRHVHLGVHGTVPLPRASDTYLPAVERRRRTTALIDGFAALGIDQTVLGSGIGSLRRVPNTTVHVHLNELTDLPHALVAAVAPTTRIVVHLRGSSRAPLRSGGDATITSRLVGGPAERWLLRRSSLVVTNSSRLAEVAETGGARRTLVVPDAPTPLPTELVGPRPRPWAERSGRRLVSLGPLVARRRSTALVETLAALPDDVHLILLGTGPDRLAIDQAARRLQVADRVAVVPTASHATVAAHLAHADVVVNASLTGDDTPELLRAMAAGRPIVATSVEGTPEHLTAGLDGSLVPPTDLGALTRSVGRLLDDRRLAATLGASAARRTRAHGWDVLAARVLDDLRR